MRAALANQEGNTAIEFAILAPVFLSMIIGLLYLSMLGFAYVSLQSAVETAARCAAVQSTICTSTAATQGVASNLFAGFGATPTFTVANAACGSQVTGQVTVSFNTVLTTVTVPLTATACHP
jgi:Flp pilus assembly protein TadG